MKKATLTLLMSVTFLYFASANKQSMSNLNERYGRLQVVSVFKKPRKEPGMYRYYANCLCDCGKEAIVCTDGLKSGDTRSCGCLALEVRTKHKLSKHKLYKVRVAIVGRCYNVKNPSYHNYGGRGIKLCHEWLNDPESFVKWCIDNGHKEGLSIDRRNNDGDYTPENCRLVTRAVQQNNKRDSVYITIDGVTKGISQWARFYGLTYSRVRWFYTHYPDKFLTLLQNTNALP